MKDFNLKSASDLRKMRFGGRILSEILRQLSQQIIPGMTTQAIDDLTLRLLKQAKVKAAFYHYRDYPARICVSVNEEVVHGIPGQKIIQDGDIIGLDLGVDYQGLITDASVTVPVGQISENDRKLINATKNSLKAGLNQIKDGAFTGDVGFAIELAAKKAGYQVVKELSGHGVGYKVHELPNIPNFGQRGVGSKLFENMTIAVEPMLVSGQNQVGVEDDGWTVRTLDHSRSAHFEVTLVVTKNGYEILTPGIIN